MDARNATPQAAAGLGEAIARRKTLTVRNHHCAPGVRHVIDVRNLYAMEKRPFFDPPGGGKGRADAGGGPDGIVRAFHNSAQCAQANVRLMHRRQALKAAWDGFGRENSGRWPAREMANARHLDYTMRTALFEGHLERAEPRARHLYEEITTTGGRLLATLVDAAAARRGGDSG